MIFLVYLIIILFLKSVVCDRILEVVVEDFYVYCISNFLEEFL